MNFEELTRAIAEASVLAKSLSAAGEQKDDKKIAAAAADGESAGGADGSEDDDTGNDDDSGKGGDGDGGDGDGDDDGEEQLGKSFRLTLEDGTEMEAFDGSQLVSQLTAQVKAEKTARVADNEMYMKSFGSTLELVKSLTTAVAESRTSLEAAQKDIESLKTTNETLQKSLKALGSQGRGRVSTVTVLDKPNANRRQQQELPTKREILAKAMSALTAKRITGTEASRVEAALNAGTVPQKELLERIFAA
ncbi:hypothetical protein [Paraburkholderia sp. MM6662-R1]|uniref:hypothetical protein n=1 Tax=Paraburkholderia sp. MM6662-R1 TaxID=2991066 RepID=UPI003D21CEFE